VETGGVLRRASRQTLAKQRVLAGDHLLVRVDQGSVDPIGGEVEEVFISSLETLASRVDAVVVSDYAYGVMTPRAIETLARLQLTRPRILVIDAKDLLLYSSVRPTAVKPNYEEAARLLGLHAARGTESRPVQIAAHGAELLERTGAHIVATTLDADGALIFEADSATYRTYAPPTRSPSPAGAGDTFVAALTLALASGATTAAAAEVASAAAAVVVEKPGTSACSLGELHERLMGEDKVIHDAARLATRLALLRGQGRRLVFTNGSFDILHSGHVAYLNRAKALGDVLVVGVNSDASVTRLKGAGRPINALEDRVQVLAALSCVDHVVPFDEDTPSELLRTIEPEVFVKGGDYTYDTLPEAALVRSLGGTVRILPYIEDRSTTRIIERISSTYAGGR
jgi:D-beta-D-heptose 7-phosphate kinase/D-beta-D-heptose 1-phosphate adenosyltransferase